VREVEAGNEQVREWPGHPCEDAIKDPLMARSRKKPTKRFRKPERQVHKDALQPRVQQINSRKRLALVSHRDRRTKHNSNERPALEAVLGQLRTIELNGVFHVHWMTQSFLRHRKLLIFATPLGLWPLDSAASEWQTAWTRSRDARRKEMPARRRRVSGYGPER